VDLASAALLGVVQGLTEFLPVSSTAHLLIGERLAGFEDPGGAFKIVIQFGSILAVMWLYRAKIASVVAGLPTDPAARRFALMIAAAFLPAALAGALLAGWVKGVLYETPTVYAWAFIAGGLVMLAAERLRPVPSVGTADDTPVGKAVFIGTCQALALVPGVSRSGATIIGGLFAGLDRAAAAEFSFFLAMPTMAGAFAYQLWTVGGELDAGRTAEIAVGFLMAFLSALAVVKPFLRFVARSGFAPFAWYRIAIGVAILGGAFGGWS
jgi:undecaprenyl-diphosphatase